MYPFVRMANEMARIRKAPRLALLDTHVSHHLCWPWDLDPWIELNNGRTLTLFDLGRLPLSNRVGLSHALKTRGWSITVAGVSVRYRKRIKVFQKVQSRNRIVCWDARFFYFEQSFWNSQGDCTTHGLFRIAMTQGTGIIPPSEIVGALGHLGEPPAIPDWIAAWIKADAGRPWPPVN